MIIRLTGALIILISSGLYGIVSARRIEERLKQLKELRSGFNVIKQEITLCAVPLGMALISGAVGMTTKIKDLFTVCGKAVLTGKGVSFKDVVVSYMEEPDILLCNKAKSIVACWASTAGSGDVNTEKDSIDYVTSQLDQLINSVTEEYDKKARLYRNSGFLIGAFAVVLML